MYMRQAFYAFLTLLLAFLILLGIQYAHPHLPQARQDELKQSDFITYYLEDTTGDQLDTNLIDTALLAQLDTIPTELEDSLFRADSLPPINALSSDSKSDSFIVPEYANIEHLERFFKSLDTAKSQRIGYWGDSMIEGDLISKTLRSKMQKQFGGAGVGFVPFVSYTAGFRNTVVHKFGGDWEYYSMVKNAKLRIAPYGISGEYHRILKPKGAKDSSSMPHAWARYTRPKKSKESWDQVRFFYGAVDSLALLKVQGSGVYDSLRLKGSKAYNAKVWKDSAINSIQFDLYAPDSTVFFGVSLETEEGIQVDNFNLRGNSGMPMTRLPFQVMRGFDKDLGYDLVVLQFGSNVVSEKTTNYSWYEAAMTRVVRHYQRCFPKASILILGLADKSYKNDEGIMVTQPAVKRVLRTQYRVAMKTGVAFFNLYAAMGGENSMAEWVEAEKPLANKDYTHFNFRGAWKIGSMLHEFLMKEYRAYQKN